MTSFKTVCLFAAGAGLLAQGAQAQSQGHSMRDLEGSGHNDTRANASITIPLGARRGSDAAKPRFDFSVATQTLGTSRTLTPLRFDANYERQTLRAATVSLTLEQNPRLLMNGQRVATFGPTLTADEDGDADGKGGGLGTGGAILIGLGLLSGAVLIATLETADEINDLVDPD